MEIREPVGERVLGFLWRWFWRIVFWGVVAVLGLIALFYVVDWAESDRAGWALAFFGGAAGFIIHQLGEIRRLLSVQIDQNADIIRRLPPVNPYIDDYDD